MTSRSALEASGKKFRTQNISDTVQKIVISPIKEMSILAERVQETNTVSIFHSAKAFPILIRLIISKKQSVLRLPILIRQNTRLNRELLNFECCLRSI